MSCEKKINVAIVGLGRAGRFMHVPELAQYPELFKVVAGCDNAPDRLEDLPEVFNGTHLTTDYDEILADDNVELVNIATRNADHVPMALKALKAGKSVVIEKPIAVDEEQGKAILAAAREYPNKCFWRFNRRFEPPFVQLREIIKSGVLGNITMIKVARHPSFVRRNDWQTLKEFNGGMLNNWGPHLVDQMLILLDSPVKEVWGSLQHVLAAGDADDQVKIVVRGENGRIAQLDLSSCSAIQANIYEIYGDRGTLAMAPDSKEFHLRYINPDSVLSPVEAIRGNCPLSYGIEKLDMIDEVIPVIEPEDGHTLQRGKVVSDTLLGDQKHGYASQDTIWLAVYRSMRLGQPYPITDEEVRSVLAVTREVERQNL